MINLGSTLEHSDRVCAICRIKFYKMRKTSDVYVSPRADISKLQKFEQDEHDSSHEAGVSASNVAVEILNSTDIYIYIL
jgi:hypothetical protein